MEDGKVVMNIEDPRKKGYSWVAPDNNCFGQKHLPAIKNLMGKNYLPAEVVVTEEGKLSVKYNLNFDT